MSDIEKLITRIDEIEARIDARLRSLEAVTAPRERRLGPSPKCEEKFDKAREKAIDTVVKALADIPPVDRTQRTLADGEPVTADHREIKENGQQRGYVVLSAAERAKGFIRPMRRTYTHCGLEPTFYEDSAILAKVGKRLDGEKACGCRTTMALAIAETYARDPGFYTGTFCAGCGVHLPLNEFVWEGTREIVGS